MIPVAEEWSRLAKIKSPGIDYDADHLAEAIRYAFHSAFMQRSVQKSYVCECKCCDLTHYTSYKRLNCEFCGCDSNQFTCKELK